MNGDVHHIHSWEQQPPRVKVSIGQTAKGMAQVSVTIRGDNDENVKARAVKLYKETLEGLEASNRAE